MDRFDIPNSIDGKTVLPEDLNTSPAAHWWCMSCGWFTIAAASDTEPPADQHIGSSEAMDGSEFELASARGRVGARHRLSPDHTTWPRLGRMAEVTDVGMLAAGQMAAGNSRPWHHLVACPGGGEQ